MMYWLVIWTFGWRYACYTIIIHLGVLKPLMFCCHDQGTLSWGDCTLAFQYLKKDKVRYILCSMPIMPSSSFTPLPLPSSSSLWQTCYSSLRPHPLGSYFPTILFHHFPSSISSSGFDQYDVAVGVGPSSDNVTVRVVDPPTRPHSGIWFMLLASPNQ